MFVSSSFSTSSPRHRHYQHKPVRIVVIILNIFLSSLCTTSLVRSRKTGCAGVLTRNRCTKGRVQAVLFPGHSLGNSSWKFHPTPHHAIDHRCSESSRISKDRRPNVSKSVTWLVVEISAIAFPLPSAMKAFGKEFLVLLLLRPFVFLQNLIISGQS